MDSADLLQRSWLDGVAHLGIAAGTSTPKEQIQSVQLPKVRKRVAISDRIEALYRDGSSAAH